MNWRDAAGPVPSAARRSPSPGPPRSAAPAGTVVEPRGHRPYRGRRAVRGALLWGHPDSAAAPRGPGHTRGRPADRLQKQHQANLHSPSGLRVAVRRPSGPRRRGEGRAAGDELRVAILPYLEPAGISQTYDPQQPWDSPKNRVLAGAAMPSAYRCPSDPKAGPGSDETSYVMLVGKNTVGGLPDGDRKASYVSGHAGTSKTILVIEVPGSGNPLDGAPRHDGRRGPPADQ